MYTRKLQKDIRCPLEHGLEIFGGKWKSRIICVLGSYPTSRYSFIREQMGNITDAVLSSSLKELIQFQIVKRVAYEEIPPRVEYTLTDKGRSVLPILRSVCRWSGLFFKTADSSERMIQCRKCDYLDETDGEK